MTARNQNPTPQDAIRKFKRIADPNFHKENLFNICLRLWEVELSPKEQADFACTLMSFNEFLNDCKEMEVSNG